MGNSTNQHWDYKPVTLSLQGQCCPIFALRQTRKSNSNSVSFSSHAVEQARPGDVRFAMYDLRHCLAFRKLKNGHDTITVANLLAAVTDVAAG